MVGWLTPFCRSGDTEDPALFWLIVADIQDDADTHFRPNEAAVARCPYGTVQILFE